MVASAGPRMANNNCKWAWSGHVNHLNFGGHCSGTAEARVVNFCTLVGYVKAQNTVTNWNGRGQGHMTTGGGTDWSKGSAQLPML